MAMIYRSTRRIPVRIVPRGPKPPDVPYAGTVLSDPELTIEYSLVRQVGGPSAEAEFLKAPLVKRFVPADTVRHSVTHTRHGARVSKTDIQRWFPKFQFRNPQIQRDWERALDNAEANVNPTGKTLFVNVLGFTTGAVLMGIGSVLSIADLVAPAVESVEPSAESLAPILSRVAAGETTQLLPEVSPLSSSFASAAAEGAPKLATVSESSLQAARLGVTSALKEAAPLATSGLEASAPVSTAARAGLWDTIKGYASYWDETLTGGALGRALTETGGITNIGGSNSPVSSIINTVTGSPGAPVLTGPASSSPAPFGFAGSSSGGSGPTVSTVYQQRAPASSPLLTWLLWGGVGVLLLVLWRLWR